MYVTSIQQKLLVKVFPLLHGVSLEYLYHIVIRAETNTKIFSLLHSYVFEYEESIRMYSE